MIAGAQCPPRNWKESVEPWSDPALRELDPTLAAARCLQPITGAG
jgi:hypothetical protein